MTSAPQGTPNRTNVEVTSHPAPEEKKSPRSRPSLPKKVTEDDEVKIERVMERVYDRRRLNRAWQSVKRNAGAAGIDRMTVEDFEKREQELLEVIHAKLEAGKYRFKPARRKEIPKPGTKKVRKLGIPVVMDRIVGQSLHTVLEEIFDPGFAASNFGFRRGKSQQQAVTHMRRGIGEGRDWCVAIDLRSFFDKIPHGLILKLIRRKISDERVATLIARSLKAGTVVDGVFEKSREGCPQGSPVSPILSNIALNELDHELERRGHRYCRWADDFVILVKTERAARRVMEGITSYLEKDLGLPVNREKSKVAPSKDVEFLGFQILGNKIRVSNKSRKRFKEKVRELTKRNNRFSMYEVIHRLNGYLRGWVAYFGIQEFKKIFRELDEFIRSRLRSMQLKKWKKPAKFQRMMIRAGRPIVDAKRTWIKMDKWQSVSRPIVKFVLNLKWFRRKGLISLDDYTHRNLKFEFAR
jgi:RNA-directed DNA polymerase